MKGWRESRFEPVFQIYFCTDENAWVWIYYALMLNLCSQASLVKWDVIRFNQSMAVYRFRVEMDESSSSMFVWFIWCSLVLTKRNEKLAKQFIRTAHEQSTFLHVLGKCGNNKSVCIIYHIIVPALVTFQISRRQTSYH